MGRPPHLVSPRSGRGPIAGHARTAEPGEHAINRGRRAPRSPGHGRSVSRAASDPIGVMVVDDHEAVRAGLERVLERAPDLAPVAVLADDREVMSLVQRERVDVAVLDYDLERGDGLSLCL